MNTTRIRRTLATLGLMLGTVAAPAEAVPVFQVNERAFGTPGCLPDTSPHLSIRCNPGILLPNGTPAIGNFDVDARAEGRVGPNGLELGMFARIDAISPFLPLFPGPGFLSPLVIAQVRFEDLVTIVAPGVPVGDPISPLVTFSVTGEACIVLCDGPPVVVGLNFAPPNPRGTVSIGLPATDEFTTRSFGGPATIVAQLNVLNGVPFAMQILADASISVDVDTAHLGFPDFFHWETHASADFSNTVRITDVRLPGDATTALTLISSDGQSLLSPAATVPEPSTAWLAGTGLVAWAWRRRLQFVSVSRSARISRLCQSYAPTRHATALPALSKTTAVGVPRTIGPMGPSWRNANRTPRFA